ncbi:ATP-binding cassette domain-containing protein, partial [Streptomyces sp. NPDC057496]|uniref:ATP-binding cassette domain-containing protein n=1 Tax=Streptomyces sp. NPDC057496 TaxID=3346149 RepID=UPI0036952F72
MTPAHHADSSPGSPGVPPPRGPLPPPIGVSGVTKRFGEVTAIGGVTLDFPAGQVTALMGENGAGKSTLLKIL